MNLEFVTNEYTKKDYLQIDGARIVHRNFAGVGTKFNREGDRNFSVVIPTREMADALLDRGWNVKIKPPREEGEDEFMYLPVKVKYSDELDKDGNRKGPTAYLVSGGNVVSLNDQTIGCIDDVDIIGVDLDIRSYDWDVNGKTGRTAYLDVIHVVQDVDRFAARYDEIK